jgi:hypothetical protein
VSPEEQRDADRRESRREVIEETLAEARGLPTYEVPPFVLERYPEFRPDDPSTWPEPDRCTDGRPWGHNAYGLSGTLGSDPSYRWQRYLAAVDTIAAAPAGRVPTWTRRDLGCRNRWRDERYLLCGTHLRPFLDRIEDAARAARVRASTERYLALAHRFAAHGIEADGRAGGLVLRAESAEAILRLLDGRASPFPTTDTTVPPPL